ncbi:hypothetical protein ACLBKT_03430 [Erythrobacter sp. W302b]|uniref:hypothetical protein n=1 Tax=Erythrobacter sp. W302b TaxID=3389874 RepID=UPI00396AF38A
MQKLTVHARIEVAIVAVLLLSSCTLDDQQQDEVSDIAADVAYDVVLEHEKIADLESRIEALESVNPY